MNNSVKTIYCISGLGADEKAFERLNIRNCSLRHLQLIAPLKKERLSSYAVRMLVQIKEERPVILGLSFGGLIAVEMAKQMALSKLILVSTVKTHNEMPTWMRLSGALNLHKFIPIKANRLTEKADDRRMGIETAEEKDFVEHYRKKADQQYVNWAVDQVLNWKNDWLPDNVYHIHGENDRMFPLKNIRATHVINKGTHIMILNRADEISRCIEQILSTG